MRPTPLSCIHVADTRPAVMYTRCRYPPRCHVYTLGRGLARCRHMAQAKAEALSGSERAGSAALVGTGRAGAVAGEAHVGSWRQPACRRSWGFSGVRFPTGLCRGPALAFTVEAKLCTGCRYPPTRCMYRLQIPAHALHVHVADTRPRVAYTRCRYPPRSCVCRRRLVCTCCRYSPTR